MRLCDYLNHTFVALDSRIRHIITVEKNQVIGQIGSCIDSILSTMDKRKCTIVGAENFGISNGTHYSGALGLMQSNQADMYLKGEPEYLDENFVKRTIPLKSESIFAGQVFKDKDALKSLDLIDSFTFDVKILLNYFGFLVFGLLLSLILNRLSMKPTQAYTSKTISLKFLHLTSSLFSNQTPSFKFCILFFSLFFWLTGLFVQNNVQVSKVIVDTKNLIKDKTDLLNTDDVVCFFKDTGFHLAEKSPKSTTLSRIFHQKNFFKDDRTKKSCKKKRCILTHSLDQYKLFEDKMVLVTTQIEGQVVMMVISEMGMIKKIWLLNKGIQEYNVVIYYNDRLEYTRKFAKLGMYAYTESGITHKMYNCMEGNAAFTSRKTMNIYTSLEDYVKENLNLANLSLESCRSIFVIYALVNLLWIFLFLISRYRKFLSLQSFQLFFRFIKSVF